MKRLAERMNRLGTETGLSPAQQKSIRKASGLE